MATLKLNSKNNISTENIICLITKSPRFPYIIVAIFLEKYRNDNTMIHIGLKRSATGRKWRHLKLHHDFCFDNKLCNSYYYCRIKWIKWGNDWKAFALLELLCKTNEKTHFTEQKIVNAQFRYLPLNARCVLLIFN